MSSTYHEKKQLIKNRILSMSEQDILAFLNKAFVFKEKVKLVFYTKTENAITGMIEIGKKMLKFEIWFSVPYNSVAITVAKITKVLKEE